GNYAHEIILLAKVSRDDDRVFLTTQRCLDRANGTNPTLGGLGGTFWWPYAERLPAQHFELLHWPDGIRTTTLATRTIGFVERAPECGLGQPRVKVDGRSWLPNGMCDCRQEPLPMVATDCRIVDDDGDGAPGITVEHRGALDGPKAVRALDNCQITKGHLQPDGRLNGYYIENYDFLALNCGGAPCVPDAITACEETLNPVAFEPLSETAPNGSAWTCAGVLDAMAAGRLFPLPMLSFVKGC
ncbi:MAG TPA: hypothetical protein VI299_07915, partial [Polyangiales bacterium]